MERDDPAEKTVQLEVSLDVLQRLLREHSLFACEVHYLNNRSFDAGRQALKDVLRR